jgi:signal transduction histidine kinase/ligand-binding sensor domain-containing protein/DNA-binding response OmpR family regulator
MKVLIITICLILFGLPVRPIERVQNPLRRDYTYQAFKNIVLPFDANIVNTIYQDQQGIMWFGTKRGLFNYNGYNIHEYINDKKSDGNSILTIAQIDSQYLSIGTDYGLLWFNLKTEQYEDIHPELEILKAIRSLAFFDNKLWIGTRDEGLYYYDIYSKELHKLALENIDETLIYALEPADDKLFVGSYECLSHYDIRTRKRYRIDFENKKRLMVNSLLWDKTNECVWIGTEGLLFRYGIVNKRLEQQPFLSGNSFKTLAIDNKGNLLIGTDVGLYVYDPVLEKYNHIIHDSRNSQSLCNNVIWDITCDRKHNIWLATDRGVSLVQANAGYWFIHLSEIVQVGDGNLFTHLYIDSKDGYWLGGENGLIYIENEKNKYQVKWFQANDTAHPLNHNRIRYIYEDRNRNIWIATDGSIARYDRDKNRFIYYTIQDISGKKNANWAYDIYEDKHGRFWVATYMGGLFILDKNELIASEANKPFSNITCHLDNESGLGNVIYQIISDDEGYMWVNTQKGLACINMETFKVELKGIFLDNMIYDNHNIWFSAQGQLFRYDISESRVIQYPFSANRGQIYSFVKENSRIWFSSTNGIFYLDTHANKVCNVSKSENYYQSGFYNQKNNEILWGGEDCVTCFSLEQIDTRQPSDLVYITTVLANGKRLIPETDYEGDNPRYGTTIKLKQRDNITLELSSYSYFQQNEETFYYQINNSEKWQSLEKGQNHISFVNLPGGEYVLRLSNTNPGEDGDAIISTYTIRIPYPWYSCWEAYLIYIFSLLGAILLFIRYIQKRHKKKYEQREKEKSLELSNLKMDFFVNISHELKTPLSLIIAPLSQLISEISNVKQKESLMSIHKNSLRLNTLIYKVLDFKQMEFESENSLIRSHVELYALLQNCIATFSTVVKEKQIQLTFSSETDTLWLNLDILKIESIFINLISNAIKYVTEKEGVIKVSLHKDGDTVCITVADNGIGIKEEELPLVFVRFFQGKNKKRHSEGTGIGLYLVRKFVELHNGHIEIWNDKGVTVEVTIPTTGENGIIMDNQSMDLQMEQESVEGTTLLIVDDNKEMVAFLVETLSKQYQCMEAYDGKEGLQAVQEYNPDLIIVDQMMPVMDGFEFSRSVRHSQPTASIPIIMLTAKDDMESELKSIKTGIDIFISKPFDIKKLILRIAQLLQKQKSMKKSIRIEAITQPDFNIDGDKRTADEILLEKVTKAIEENMEKEEFNIIMLTEIMAIDQKQLYRKIKQLTGMTPINYMRKLKMKKAAVLLTQEKFTISEVMYLVGYTNASYFTKCFSEEFGLTPKQFIINNKEKKYS